MASLKRFTVTDPKARVNLSLKRSTRAGIEQYLLFYAKTHGETAERSELVEELLGAWFEQDKDYLKFLETLTAKERADIETGCKKAEKDNDAKAA